MYDQDFNCLNQRLVYHEKDTNKQFKAIFDVGHQRLNRVYIFCINSASMFLKFLKERVCFEKHFFQCAVFPLKGGFHLKGKSILV